MKRFLPAFCILSLLGGAQNVRGQTPTLRAEVKSSEVVIDGVLNEVAWEAATPATGFRQSQPVEGAAAEYPTFMRALVDAEAVYMSFRMVDPAPEKIAREMVRRDEEGNSDLVMFGFDTNLDRRTSYGFIVSAAGVQRDVYLYDDDEDDDTWDAVWESAVSIDDSGWSAEVRIPLSQMRYQASDEPQTWGFNAVRRRTSTNEETHFRVISQLQEGVVSQFGLMENVLITKASRRLEVRPYVLARGSKLSKALVAPDNPFEDRFEPGGRFGVDVRYGIGAQFTLDATINPDFGQVEADPAVINLSAFETFLRERRPFFVEDASVFDYGLSGHGQLFYSRRIGRRPRGGAPGNAVYSDRPEAATILGAAKLTGRTSSGLTIGALAAVTDREKGRYVTSPAGRESRFNAEPRSGFAVFRAQQDLRDGATAIGGMTTLMTRGLPENGDFSYLPKSAFAAGLDWEHRWADRKWAWYGYAALSHVRGDSTAITRVQRSSSHYFQRPDSRTLTLDSSRTALTGMDWRMTFAKQRGNHWTWSVWAAQVTPGFEVNDLGFSSRQEVIDGGARVTYREINPGPVLRNYAISASTFQNWTHDALKDPFNGSNWGRAHVRGGFSFRSDMQLLNYWGLESSFSFSPEKMDRTATRGGPLMLEPRGYSTRFEVKTDERKRLNFSPDISFEWGEQDAGTEFKIGLEIEYRPTSRVQIQVEPGWSHVKSGSQYVGRSDALPFTPTFGTRYLFADLDRRELELETRVSVAFSPTLSLQLFAQPLMSAGEFSRYKQLLASESFDFEVFTDGSATSAGCSSGSTCVDADGERYIDFDGDGTADTSFGDRSFNVRSLIGNAVLRWEYRPGSTLFLVWQREQEDEIMSGTFDFQRDARALFDSPAHNVFMIKLNYWFGV